MYEEAIISGLIVGASLLIGLYSIIKSNILNIKILEILSDFLDDVSRNEEMAKKLYMVGAILGNGVVSGTGIQKKGGKFGIQDLIVQALGSWLNKSSNEMPAPGESNAWFLKKQP